MLARRKNQAQLTAPYPSLDLEAAPKIADDVLMNSLIKFFGFVLNAHNFH